MTQITNPVAELLILFDQLATSDQALAFKEIYKRFQPPDEAPPLEDGELVFLADQLFQLYDEEEARNAPT